MSIEAIYSDSLDDVPAELKKLKTVTDNLDVFINAVDAVYIRSFPTKHYEQIKKVLNAGKHVLCESPITLDKQQCKELFELAQAKGCILMEAIKTAYNTAFSRLVLLAKSGKIGDVVSVDADAGVITNETTGERFTAQPFPPFIREIIEAGGLINRTKAKLAAEKTQGE